MDFFASAYVTRDVVADSEDNRDVVVKDGIRILDNAMSSGLDTVKCEICGLVEAKYKCPGCFCQTCSLQCSKQHKLDTTCTGVRSKTHFIDRKKYNEQDMMSGNQWLVILCCVKRDCSAKHDTHSTSMLFGCNSPFPLLDYNFLEEVGRTVDNAARDNLTSGRHSNHQKRKRDVVARGKHNRGQDEPEEHVSVTELSMKAAQDLERQAPDNCATYREKQLYMHVRKRGARLIRMPVGLAKRKENTTHWKDK
jgi:hypothetical protein